MCFSVVIPTMTHLEIGFPAVFSKKVTFWSKPPLSLYGRRESMVFDKKSTFLQNLPKTAKSGDRGDDRVDPG